MDTGARAEVKPGGDEESKLEVRGSYSTKVRGTPAHLALPQRTIALPLDNVDSLVCDRVSGHRASSTTSPLAGWKWE